MAKHSVDWMQLVRSLGLESVASGTTASEQSLRKVFSIASEAHCAARFLRLGGPRQFRADIIAIVDETGNSVTPGYKMLLDSNIPEIEFLLTNPYSEAFLTRMDAERKTNWDIWRVKEQIEGFARGLIMASQQRAIRKLGEIRLAFHSADLVWNLSIADEHCVIARAYYRSATGHDDNVTELYLRPESPSRLAESLIAYYNSIKNDPRTDFIRTEDELKSIGAWPSLFKGNAVQNISDSSDPWLEKSCGSEPGDRAEEIWLSREEIEMPECFYFNPVKLDRRKYREEPWKGQTFCIRRVDGVLAIEMLWHAQRVGTQYPELIPKLELLSGSVIYQAFQALREFRSVVEHDGRLREKLLTYPWVHKLESAFLEAGRFVIKSQRELSECRNEARKIGRILETKANQPFRDAHLKNRMIAIDKNLLCNGYKELHDWLQRAGPEEIFERLRRTTYDIDFETCLWKVSEWDDPLHILWSNHLGLDHVQELDNDFSLFKPWWVPPVSSSDKETMWMTLLCRSLREYCRRLWYDHIMPETYQQRYGIENRDRFLELALVAARHVDGYTAIKVFLDKCKSSGDSIWNCASATRFSEPIAVRFPSFIIQNPNSSMLDHDSSDAQLVPLHALPSSDLKPTTKPAQIEILFLSANPSDTDRLRLDREIRELNLALSRSEFRDYFKVDQYWAVRVSDLQGYLLQHRPNIVHFSGHGSQASNIILEDNFGNSQPVSTHALSQLFSVLRDNIQCVVLNACYSEVQAQAIAEHIDCVIGMSKAIGDSSAISFAVAFYQALGYGRSIKTAFDLGCVQIELETENLGEQETPKLLAIRKNPEEIKFVAGAF